MLAGHIDQIGLMVKYISDEGFIYFGAVGGVDLADFIGWLADLQTQVAEDGFCLTSNTRLATKLYVLDVNPTAEQLSRHWFHRLAPRVLLRSSGLARLAELRVWETPNCRACYSE